MIGTHWINGYKHWEPRISMATTDPVLPWRCKEIAGGFVSRPTRPVSSRFRPAQIWTIKSRAVTTTIDAMRPHIRLKRPQAALLYTLRSRQRPGAKPGDKGVLALTTEELEFREMLRLACRALNHRGTDPLPGEMAAALTTAESLGLTDLRMNRTGSEWMPCAQPLAGS